MAKYIHIPALQIGRSGQWVLSGDLIYESDVAAMCITVPSGFETDLASIPRIFQLLIQQDGTHRPAAIVHDWLCGSKATKRTMADRVFLEAMTVVGEQRWRRYSMYAAVSLFTLWLKLWRKA